MLSPSGTRLYYRLRLMALCFLEAMIRCKCGSNTQFQQAPQLSLIVAQLWGGLACSCASHAVSFMPDSHPDTSLGHVSVLAPRPARYRLCSCRTRSPNVSRWPFPLASTRQHNSHHNAGTYPVLGVLPVMEDFFAPRSRSGTYGFLLL